MIETKIGDFSTPQNDQDKMLLEKFPNVPLSIMRDIFDIHKSFSEEQADDFTKASLSNDWTEYDKKYNITNINYDSHEEVLNNMKKHLILEEITENELEEIE